MSSTSIIRRIRNTEQKYASPSAPPALLNEVVNCHTLNQLFERYFPGSADKYSSNSVSGFKFTFDENGVFGECTLKENNQLFFTGPEIALHLRNRNFVQGQELSKSEVKYLFSTLREWVSGESPKESFTLSESAHVPVLPPTPLTPLTESLPEFREISPEPVPALETPIEFPSSDSNLTPSEPDSLPDPSLSEVRKVKRVRDGKVIKVKDPKVVKKIPNVQQLAALVKAGRHANLPAAKKKRAKSVRKGKILGLYGPAITGVVPQIGGGSESLDEKKAKSLKKVSPLSAALRSLNAEFDVDKKKGEVQIHNHGGSPSIFLPSKDESLRPAIEKRPAVKGLVTSISRAGGTCEWSMYKDGQIFKMPVTKYLKEDIDEYEDLSDSLSDVLEEVELHIQRSGLSNVLDSFIDESTGYLYVEDKSDRESYFCVSPVEGFLDTHGEMKEAWNANPRFPKFGTYGSQVSDPRFYRTLRSFLEYYKGWDPISL